MIQSDQVFHSDQDLGMWLVSSFRKIMSLFFLVSYMLVDVVLVDVVVLFLWFVCFNVGLYIWALHVGLFLCVIN